MTKTSQYQRLHMYRVICFVLLLSGMAAVQFVSEERHVAASPQVLAYAVNVTNNDLLQLSNQERSKSGLKELSLNAKLNQAAQAKAEHMVMNNYWSHEAPDGTTPWSFFDQVNYNYINAGENLAYGFLTSNGAVSGWMNSEGHRANVLGDYKDVGFGQAKGSNYQGGNNTVIVALYGTEVAGPTPIASTAPANTPTLSATSTYEDMAVSPVPSQNIAQSQTRVPVLTATINGTASLGTYTGLGVIIFITLGLIITHTKLLTHGWNQGYRYAVTHPIIDAAVVGSIAVLFLSASAGYIQ